MGKNLSCCKKKKMAAVDKKTMYYRAEFNAMDKDKDGKITTAEFIKLLFALGFSGGAEKARNLLKEINKDEDGIVTFQEFLLAVTNNPDVIKETSNLRELFNMFDKDNSGTVTKSDLFDGLKEMGVVIADETKNTIEAINAKKITYEDFVRAQLKL